MQPFVWTICDCEYYFDFKFGVFVINCFDQNNKEKLIQKRPRKKHHELKVIQTERRKITKKES